MKIVISRDGDLNVRTAEVPQEQKDALWAAFVTSWVEKNQDQFLAMLQDEAPARA